MYNLTNRQHEIIVRRLAKHRMLVYNAHHFAMGAGLAAGAVVSAALLLPITTAIAHADNIPGTDVPLPTTQAGILAEAESLLTNFNSEMAAGTGQTSDIQQALVTAGEISWLSSQSTELEITNDTIVDPAKYLYAGEEGPIINDQSNYQEQIINFFNHLIIPTTSSADTNSSLASALNTDVADQIDINNAIIGNPSVLDGDISAGVEGNVQNGDLIALTVDNLSLLHFDSDLYQAASWTADVALVLGL